MPIQLVVFDMAGTTVQDQSNVAEAFQRAFLMNGITIERELVQPLMGYHKPQAIEMVLEKIGSAADTDLVEEIHSDFESEMMAFYESHPAVKPMPGAEEIFAWLKEREVKVALNTGFSALIAEVIVSRFLWEDKGLVDEYIGSDEVEKGRPYPYMIQELMKRTRVSDPSHVAKIGDTPVDIEEGRNAGCAYIIGVTMGASAEADIVNMNPTHIIHHLSQLTGIL